ncbi:MAG: VCBS repeat-containing protein [Acidobacteriota bacterium]
MKAIENIPLVSRWLRHPGIRRVQGLALVVGIALAPVLAHRMQRAAATASATASSKPTQIQRARMSDEISIHAAGRGNPWINLSDGHELITPYSGPAELTQILERNEARPLSLCSADFDEDGVPDLISGYAGPNGGIVALLRGNVDSIYPNAHEAQNRRAEGTFTDAPFLAPAYVFGVPEAADFIGAGDFDGDGHWDVVAAARGSNRLQMLSGDGRGGLRETTRIDLPGGVTAMVVGEINRRDGLDDVVVGVSGEYGAKVLVFEGPEGALRANPEIFDAPAEVTSMTLGQLNDEYEMDLAVASGSELLLVHGRDRRLSLDAARQAEVKAAEISGRTFLMQIRSIAVGDFTGRHTGDIALLLDDGSIHAVNRDNAGGDLPSAGKSVAEWREDVLAGGSWSWQGQLVSARMASAPSDTLLVLDSSGRQLHVVAIDDQTRASDAEATTLSPISMSLDAEGAPVAVLPMRLNEDALSDLVVLSSGHSAVAVAKTRPQAAFVVINTNDSGVGSLRQAILDANNSAGADTISFNIPGAGTKSINLQSSLPIVTGAVTIDATTQPGFAGTPLIAIRSNRQGSTLQITGGNSVVRGLDICTVAPSSLDIEILTAGANRIEGDVISELGVTIRSSNNVVGGTTPSASNKFADNPSSANVVLTGQSATGNQVRGNSFLAQANTCLNSQGCGVAISVSGANNVIGGTVPQARNIIFGSPSTFDILVDQSGTGTIIQGNFIGVDVSGTRASGSRSGVQVWSINTTIGGTTSQARNVISGHLGTGVVILSTSATDTFNLVQGNYIGTDSTGTNALGNSDGVVISLAKKTTIGGNDASRNVISGNRGDGVFIVSVVGTFGCGLLLTPTAQSVDFPVLSNYIGTDASGTQRIGNGRNGVEISVDSFSHEISRNRIAFNGRSGIAIPEFSFSASGRLANAELPAFSIKILNNAIFSNGILGIDLVDDGVTQNDLRDLDAGANLRQNFPVLISSNLPSAPADGTLSPAASLSVSGNFNSKPNSTFTLQFFFGSGCVASGHQFIGAIPVPLGSLPVSTDGNGNASYTFSFEFPVGRSSGFVNCTATDASDNTSEASTCLAVMNPLRIVSACKGEGKQLVINGSGFVDGAKVYINGVVEKKTRFASSTQVIAFKAGKRTFTGDTLKVRNPDGSETQELTYTRVDCPP